MLSLVEGPEVLESSFKSLEREEQGVLVDDLEREVIDVVR